MTDLESVAADFETVQLDVDDPVEHVATITLNRPEARNAMNEQLRRELIAVLTAIEDSSVRVVVITGAADARAFVAGADVTELRDRDMVEQRTASEPPRVYEHVDELRQPVIARINGHALGGGCELALACDIRIARRDAKLGQPEINLGLLPGGGGTQRLPRLIGEGNAMRLVLSGELVDGTEAEKLGLVDVACDPDSLDETVYGLAESIAAKSPVAVAAAKDAIRAASRLGLDDGLRYESSRFVQLFGTADKNEGIDAFLEDRAPEWSGR